MSSILYIFHEPLTDRLDHDNESWFMYGIRVYPERENSWCIGWDYDEVMDMAQQYWATSDEWKPYPYVLERAL